MLTAGQEPVSSALPPVFEQEVSHFYAADPVLPNNLGRKEFGRSSSLFLSGCRVQSLS